MLAPEETIVKFGVQECLLGCENWLARNSFTPLLRDAKLTAV
jgi:hypothetical protein